MSQSDRHNLPSANLPDFVEDYLDGIATDAQRDALTAWLRASPENLKGFAQYAYLDGAIGSILSSQQHTQEAHESQLFDLTDHMSLLDQLALLEPKEPLALVDFTEEAKRRKLKKHQEKAAENRWRLGLNQGDSNESNRHQYVIPKLIAGLGLAAVIGLVVIPLLTLFQDKPEPNQQDASTPDAIIDAPYVAPVLATVVRTLDAQWSDDDLWNGNTGLRQGRHHLASGLVEIELGKGTRVVLEAPVSFELTGTNEMTLSRGRLVANVPPAAIGFTIDTPSARITDYGTEFGVNIRGDGSSLVSVFQGTASLQLRDSGHSPSVSSGVVQLASRQLIEIDATGNFASSPTAFDIDRQVDFARSIDPDGHTTLQMARLIRQSNPVAHWRFDDIQQGLVENAVSSRYPARVVGSLSLIPAPAGEAALFHPDRSEPAYFLVDDPVEELAGRRSYSVEVWFRADDPGSSVLTLVGLFDALTPGTTLILVHLEIEGQRSYRNLGEARFRFLNRNPPGSDGGTNVYHPARGFGDWTHIVVVKDEAQMRLFINGTCVATKPDTNRAITFAPTVIIGDHPAARSGLRVSKMDSRPFRGAIDELAIYAHALTEEEIRVHAAFSQEVCDE